MANEERLEISVASDDSQPDIVYTRDNGKKLKISMTWKEYLIFAVTLVALVGVLPWELIL